MPVDIPSLLNLLKSELERSTGCTDPGAVALAVARAARELGTRPETVDVLVSPNVFKNGISVGIPGTGERGLVIAAALGAVIDRCEAGLAIFDSVTPGLLEQARKLVSAGRVLVHYADAPDPLYIRAELSSGGHRARAVIMNDYSNITEVVRDGDVILSSPFAKASEVQNALAGSTLETLFGLIDAMTAEDLEFLLQAAQVNRRAADIGLGDPSLKLGRSLDRRSSVTPQPFAAMSFAQVWTAAASEARMAGLKVPVMAIAGSGNHGITVTLGILAAAETLGSPRALLARALARGAVVTIMIKSHVHRMTAFCGCAVAASTGVAAGTVYLLGGDFSAAERAMQTVIGTLAGMLCDGAKESCAYKLSTSASLAIQAAFAAMEGVSIPAGMGIVGATAEDSFTNLGELNDPGMLATDRLVLKLIGKNASPES